MGDKPIFVALGAIIGAVLTELIRRLVPTRDKILDGERSDREYDRKAAKDFRDELRGDIVNLRRQISVLETENTSLLKQVSEMTIEIAKLRTEIARLEAVLEDKQNADKRSAGAETPTRPSESETG